MSAAGRVCEGDAAEMQFVHTGLAIGFVERCDEFEEISQGLR
jgi:hypothetical protein